MPSRQDQLHSYQFMVQRVVAALVMRETDPARSPFRRAAGATLASVLVAVIGLGAVAAYGAIVGGGGSGWRDPDVVIVEKESGARYVYREGRLHPVLNYTSALLIVAASEPKTVLVSRRSIEGVPRGAPMGIAAAPDSLPPAKSLVGAPWTVCTTSPTGESAARSTLLIGVAVRGGRLLADEALLARHPDGSVYLLWHNRRHLLRDSTLVLGALGWASQHLVPAAPALINAFPAGADLARLSLADQGSRSVQVPGAKIGEVFVVVTQGGGRQYAVAKRDGLAGITPVQADLQLYVMRQEAPTELSPGQFAGIPRLSDLFSAEVGAPPATAPSLASVPEGKICGEVRDDTGVSRVWVGATAPDDADGTGAASTIRADSSGSAVLPGGVSADRVVVAPGRGAVVEAAAAPGASGGAICVITDLGQRYAVADAEVLTLLGYGQVTPLRLPANVVALVPAGTVLDPELAQIPVVPSGR